MENISPSGPSECSNYVTKQGKFFALKSIVGHILSKKSKMDPFWTSPGHQTGIFVPAHAVMGKLFSGTSLIDS